MADWRVTYRTDEGELRAYVITMLEDNIREVRITQEDSVADGSTGVEVAVSELHRDYRSLEAEHAGQELAENFALYLKDYRQVCILYEGSRVTWPCACDTARRAYLERRDFAFSGATQMSAWQLTTRFRSVTLRALSAARL